MSDPEQTPDLAGAMDRVGNALERILRDGPAPSELEALARLQAPSAGILELHAQDCPCCKPGGPVLGDRQWTFTLRLRSGVDLKLHAGPESHAWFRNTLLREEMDDFVDAAVDGL
jgi:hypothetical protein